MSTANIHSTDNINPISLFALKKPLLPIVESYVVMPIPNNIGIIMHKGKIINLKFIIFSIKSLPSWALFLYIFLKLSTITKIYIILLIFINSKIISTNGTVKKYCNEQIVPLFKDDILIVILVKNMEKALKIFRIF